MCKYHLANQNLTKFANYSALFPQVKGNAGQEIQKPVTCSLATVMVYDEIDDDIEMYLRHGPF